MFDQLFVTIEKAIFTSIKNTNLIEAYNLRKNVAFVVHVILLVVDLKLRFHGGIVSLIYRFITALQKTFILS